MEGLLFARPDDQKSEMFVKAGPKSLHRTRHSRGATTFHRNLSRADPRYRTEAYYMALAIAMKQWRDDGSAVLGRLGEDGFVALDIWKQRGFSQGERGFIAPRDATGTAFAHEVYQFAWRAVTTLDFVLKSGNLERYIENARSMRAKWPRISTRN